MKVSWAWKQLCVTVGPGCVSVSWFWFWWTVLLLCDVQICPWLLPSDSLFGPVCSGSAVMSVDGKSLPPCRRTCSEAARPGSLCCQVALSLYLCLMTASPAAWTAWRWAGISVMLSLLLWPENSRVMFCMRDKSHLCPQQWARILPAYSQHRHPSSNHLSFGWVSVAAAGVVRRGSAVWRWINIRR